MSIQLIVQEVPEQPKNVRINSQQSRSLQVTWSQPYAGNSPIEHYTILYKMITGMSSETFCTIPVHLFPIYNGIIVSKLLNFVFSFFRYKYRWMAIC